MNPLLSRITTLSFYIATTLLKLCDQLRDEKLPSLGMLLEDKGGRTVIKYVGKQAGQR